MNEYLKRFREQYPDYNDMSDAELARALHRKYYMDMSFPEFAEKIGLDPQAEARDAAEKRLAASGSATGDFLHMLAEGATFGAAIPPSGAKPSTFARPDDPRWDPAVRQQARDQFQQRTDDLRMLNGRTADAVAVGGALLPLGAATGAIRAARGSGMAPGLKDIRPLREGGGSLEMLKLLARSPFVRGAGIGAGAIEGLRRVF